jgi:hypothetical protein
MSEAQEFFDAVAQIPAPKHRAHELRAIERLIPAAIEVEPPPATLEFFVRCEAFKTCARTDFIWYLTRVGVQDAPTKCDRWTDGRGYQFVKLPLETAHGDFRRIAKYTFRGCRITIASKVQHNIF